MKTKARPSPLMLCLLAACASNEASSSCSSPGDLGRVELAYVSGLDCEYGCNMDAAMMVGTSERVSVDPQESVTTLTAESSNPRVFAIQTSSQSFSCHTEDEYGTGIDFLPDTCGEGLKCKFDCERQGGSYRAALALSVRAESEGESTLIVRDGTGEIFDRIDIRVKEAKSAQLEVSGIESPLADGDSFDLALDVQQVWHARILDEDGERLRASIARAVSTDPSVLRVEIDERDGWFGSVLESPTDGGRLVPVAAGVANIEVEAGRVRGRVLARVK